MEEMQGLRLARTAPPNGEERSECGGGVRSSSASRMENYAEIFGGFASSCSIPVLVLPEAMDGYEEELAGCQSSGLNYLEIFGVLDAGTFSLSYEELLSLEKGSKEEDEGDRFLDEIDVGQVETGPPELLPAEVPVGGHITFSKVNRISSSFHSKFDAVRTSQQSIVDEVNNTICGPDLEAETTSPSGFGEDDNSRNVTSNDHILSGYMTEEKEAGKHGEILICGAAVDGSENDLNDAYKPPSTGAAYDLKQHSRSSSYHSTSSGDIPLSDYAFLKISDINLHTQPLEVPPPLRAPPKIDMKQGMSKSEVLEPPNIISNRNYQAHHAGGPRTRHALKETVKSTPIYSNVEVDASKAAAASAAAMIEAMEQAQASLKSAKELMERKLDSPQSDRRSALHDFGICNGQNIIFSGESKSKHKTKMAQKVVPSQVERVTSVLSEDAEEATHGKESRSYKLSDEKGRSHEWKIDKQFYELVSSEKLIRTRVSNDEKYNRNEDFELVHRLDAYQYFPEKESCGLQGQGFLHGGDDNEDKNKVEMLNTFRKNENKMFSEGEFQMQDGNAKKLKSGVKIDKEEIMNIFETSARDEDRENIVRALQVPNEDIKRIVDPISLIQHDRNENELKQCQESSICAVDKNNADCDAEPNACGSNGSGLMAFCMDRKLEEFDGGEALEETREQVKETHLYTSGVEEISETSAVFDYDAFRSDECVAHSRKEDDCNVTSEFVINKKLKETKLSSLQNANEVGVDTEYRTSFSCEKEKSMEATREDCQHGMLKQTKKETYASYNDGKDFEVERIDNTCKQENRSFSRIDKTCEPVKKQRAKWNIPSRSELNVAKLFVQPVRLEKTKEALEFQQNEGKKVHELPQKLEIYEGRLTADGEQRTDEKYFSGKVHAALELEKKIMGLSATQHVFQGIKVQVSDAQRAHSLDNKGNILGSFVDTFGSPWKQMEKSIPEEWRDTNGISKEILDGERNKEAEQKRKLEEKERAREREKDMIAVEKETREDCERVFTEAREKHENILLERVAADARQPITAYRDKFSAEAFERFEKVVNEAKLWAERAAVERATTEARERAIERALAEQASLGARRQVETSGNISKDKNWKYNESEGIVGPGDKESDDNPKPTFDVHDAPISMKSQREGCEGESPLRCKARQERCQRIVERAAKALAEKNMRDLLAQKEQAERNRLAESLDAEVRRWSSGKEGNLRALLSTLQYILGHDSGWQPIPLTEVITATAARKAYRKATLYVHPDKLQQRGATIQHKYICEKVFDLLKDAWNRFNSEG